MRCCVTLEQSEDPYARDLLEIAGEISGKRRQKVKNTIGKKKGQRVIQREIQNAQTGVST